MWAWDFDPQQLHRDILYKMFLDSPTSEILLELVELVGDYKASFFRINRYFEYKYDSFDEVLFVKSLFEGLEKVYRTNAISIKEFGKYTYEMWNQFPNSIHMEEPFHILNYAGDPLSWGDEQQTRSLYEKAFNYYKDGNSWNLCFSE